jgi:hypothetical protein
MYAKIIISKQLKAHLFPCQNCQGNYFSKQKDMNDVICAHLKFYKKNHSDDNLVWTIILLLHIERNSNLKKNAHYIKKIPLKTKQKIIVFTTHTRH